MNDTQQETTLANVTIAVDQSKLAELYARKPVLLKLAEDYKISDNETYEASLALIETIIQAQNSVQKFFADSKDLAFKTHRAICKQEGELFDPYKTAEKLLSQKRIDYWTEQERLREQREQQDRKKLTVEREEQAIATAADLERQGEREAAIAVIDEAAKAPAPAVIAQSTLPRQKGTSKRGKWEIRIDDDEKVPRNFCSPDDTKIKAQVLGFGEKHGIPGVTAVWRPTEGYKRR